MEVRLGERAFRVDGAAGTWTVGQLKNALSAMASIPAVQQILLVNGDPLLNDLATLEDCGVSSGAALDLLPKVVLGRAGVPELCARLESKHGYIREEAVLGLGHVAGASTEDRDAILSHPKALTLILRHCDKHSPMTMLQKVSTSLTRLTGGRPRPAFELVKPCIPHVVQLLNISDYDVALGAARTLLHLTGGGDANTREVSTSGAAPRAVDLLMHEHDLIKEAALKALHNMAAAERNSTSSSSTIVSSKALSNTVQLLSSDSPSVRAAACGLMSLCAHRGPATIAQILRSGALPRLVEITSSDTTESDERREAAWALTNMTIDGNSEQKAALVHSGAVEALCECLGDVDARVVIVALEGIGNALEGKDRDVPARVLKCHGAETMRLLRANANTEVASKASRLVTVYFPETGKKDSLASGASESEPSTPGDATAATRDVRTAAVGGGARDAENAAKDDAKGEESIKVVVRCRPFIKNEAKECQDAVHVDAEAKAILVKDPAASGFVPEDKSTWRSFTFDTVYGKASEQEAVYTRTVSKMVPRLLKGFNSTIFAYGQTSSGKTHTMMGVLQDDKLEGVTPRLIRHLFEMIEQGQEEGSTFIITVSYLEIYNERVYDLLGRRSKKRRGGKARESLKIRQRKGGFYVPNLTKHVVTEELQMLSFIDAGSRNRSVAATTQNSESSRSHSMLIIYIEKGRMDQAKGMKNIVGAKLNLVDLAGSERFQGLNAQMQKESTSINQSLTSLANVIAALTSTKKNTFIPYRNSSLTKLLRDSLGGNALTIMFANVNPCDRNASETVSTLRYASRAKKIKNKPKVNQNPKDALLTKLQGEIRNLRRLLQEKDRYIAQTIKNPDAFAAAAAQEQHHHQQQQQQQQQETKATSTRNQPREPTEEERKEAKRHRDFMAQVRADLMSRLNDAKRSVIRGGVASPRAAARRGGNPFAPVAPQRRRMTVVGAKNIIQQVPLDSGSDDEDDSDDVSGAVDVRLGMTKQRRAGSAGPESLAALRELQSPGRSHRRPHKPRTRRRRRHRHGVPERRASISELLPPGEASVGVDGAIHAGVFKAMRKMRKSKAKYQSQTIELRDVLDHTNKEKASLSAKVEKLQLRLAESENHAQEVETMLEQARAHEDQLLVDLSQAGKVNKVLEEESFFHKRKLDTAQKAVRDATERVRTLESAVSELKKALGDAGKVSAQAMQAESADDEPSMKETKTTPPDAQKQPKSVTTPSTAATSVHVVEPPAELTMYARYINYLFGSDTQLSLRLRLLPLPVHDLHALLLRLRDGAVYAWLLNFSAPNTVDPRAMALSRDANREQCEENMVLVLQSCKATGVRVGDMAAPDLLWPPSHAPDSGTDISTEALAAAGDTITRLLGRLIMAALVRSAARVLLTQPLLSSRIPSAKERPESILLTWFNGEISALFKRNKALDQLCMTSTSVPDVPMSSLGDWDADDDSFAGWVAIVLTAKIHGDNEAAALAKALFSRRRMRRRGRALGVEEVAASGVVPAFALPFLRASIGQWCDSKLDPSHNDITTQTTATTTIPNTDSKATNTGLPRKPIKAKTLNMLFLSALVTHCPLFPMLGERERLSQQIETQNKDVDVRISQLRDDIEAQMTATRGSTFNVARVPDAQTRQKREDQVKRAMEKLASLQARVERIRLPDRKQRKASAAAGAAAGGEPHEERVFRNWINDLDLAGAPYIHDLVQGSQDGTLLLRVLERLAQSTHAVDKTKGGGGVVDWRRVSPKPKNKFQRLENCNQFIGLCKGAPFRLVLGTTSGSDIVDGSPKRLLAVLWQLMRFHMFAFLRGVYGRVFGAQLGAEPRGKGRSGYAVAIDETKILKWANDSVHGALFKRNGAPESASHLRILERKSIQKFDDRSLTDSVFLLLLLWAVDERCIDWKDVADAKSRDDRMDNACYAISVARRLGATVFLTADDILAVKPKMILMFVGAVLALDNKSG